MMWDTLSPFSSVVTLSAKLCLGTLRHAVGGQRLDKKPIFSETGKPPVQPAEGLSGARENICHPGEKRAGSCGSDL